MKRLLNNFYRDEDGAVTVDWVVLTAAIVGIGVAAVSSAQRGVDTLSGKIEASVSVVGTGS